MSVWKSDENFSVLHPQFLLLKSFCLRSNIKHSTQCFITTWNTSKFVKNNQLSSLGLRLMLDILLQTCLKQIRLLKVRWILTRDWVNHSIDEISPVYILTKRNCCYGGQVGNRMKTWTSYSNNRNVCIVNNNLKGCNLALVKILRENQLNWIELG